MKLKKGEPIKVRQKNYDKPAKDINATFVEYLFPKEPVNSINKLCNIMLPNGNIVACWANYNYPVGGDIGHKILRKLK